MWFLGAYLGPVVGRPRPSPDLIQVADRLAGYSFPSVLALVYVSTIGFLAVLFAAKRSGVPRMTAVIAGGLLLLAALAARISLGAHWPSDILLSYLIGMLWAYALIRFTLRRFA
jgi:undecaprenyl-diphosphatase